MFIRGEFSLFVLFFNLTYGLANDLVVAQQDHFDRNLKVIRKDFNKFIENIEDIAGDVLMQMRDAGNLLENTIASNDYNWEDDQLNSILKRTKIPSILKSTTIETPSSTQHHFKTPSNFMTPLPNTITKNMKKNNFIKHSGKRERRSTHSIHSKMPPSGNLPPAPMTPKNSEKEPVPIPNNLEQRSNPPPMLSFALPLADYRTKFVEDRKDRNRILEAKPQTQEVSPAGQGISYLPDQKTENSPICAAKSQQELNLEKQKIEAMKTEVKRLNEIASLLADQQRIIQKFSDGEINLGGNEENIKNDEEQSFLHKAINQLKHRRKDSTTETKQKESDILYDQAFTTNIGTRIENPGPTIEDLENVKSDLRNTAENLNKTKEILVKEKLKEESFEHELKRQNSELKFMKVMMESLYDKIDHTNTADKIKNRVQDDKQRMGNEDFTDGELDSILEAVHVPMTMPRSRMPHRTTPNSQFLTDLMDQQHPKLESLSQLRNDKPSNYDKWDRQFIQWIKDPAVQEYLRKILKVKTAEQSEKAVINPAENDPNRFKMIHQNSATRESTAEENGQRNMRTFLSRLNGENASDKVNNDKNTTNNLDKIHSKVIDSFDNMNARASNSDLDFKLKLVKMLADNGKSDDDSKKEKELDEGIKKLIEPEKKTDDLDTLIKLMKEKRDEPSIEKTSQENLKKLLQSLNNKPQKKSDDIDVEIELRQLQKAIDSLRPKQDTFLDNVDLNNIDNNRRGKQGDFQSVLTQLIAQNGGGLPAQGNIDSTGTSINSGLISSSVNTKLTPRQILEISKIMGAGNHDSISVSPYSTQGLNSNPVTQQLLNQYTSPSITVPFGNSNEINAFKELIQNHGSPLYPHSSSNYGSSTPNLYSSLYSFSPNSYYSSLNANKLDSLYTPDPSSIPYSPTSNTYGPFNSNAYAPNYYASQSPISYNTKPYSESGIYGSNPNTYVSPYALNNIAYPSPNAPIETFKQGFGPSQVYYANSVVPHADNSYSAVHYYSGGEPVSYHSNNPSTKNEYQGPSYQKPGPGGYSSNTNTASVNYAPHIPQTYGSEGSHSYQSSSNSYSGLDKEKQISYVAPNQGNGINTYQIHGKQFFRPAGSSSSSGGNYQGPNYESKSYGGPSLDKPYGNGQNDGQYKYSMATDLAKQIESLESAIAGLNKGDYSTQEEKNTVASLEQRIYELKGVINSLENPAYKSPQIHSGNEDSYEAGQPKPVYPQNQGTYKQPQTAYAPIPSTYKEGPPSGYNSNVYQALSGNSNPTGGYQNPYQATSVASQPASGTGYPPPIPYTASSQPQITNPQPLPPSYTPSFPSNVNYNQAQPNQPSDNHPPLYQDAPHVDTPAPAEPKHPSEGYSYQSKSAEEGDKIIYHGRKMDHGYGHKKVQVYGKKEVNRGRRTRQVEVVNNEQELPQVPPQVADADISINMRQNSEPSENRPVGYDIGDDTLTQIAYKFKKYLEDNLTQSNFQNDPNNNIQARNSVMESLQTRLDSLKNQLELQRPSGRSLNDIFGATGMISNVPSTPSYGANYNLLNYPQKNTVITSLDKPVSDKAQDILTQIILKFLDKTIGALPSVLHRIFGNLISSVGDSYGDSYNPLQSILKNLGVVGYIPLILIKLLDVSGTVVHYLSKNKFFKSFLLPGVAVAAAGVGILFLVYFYQQQDEPYGYISYQGHDDHNKYPQYDSSFNGNNNYGTTNYDNYKLDPHYNTYRTNLGPQYSIYDKPIYQDGANEYLSYQGHINPDKYPQYSFNDNFENTDSYKLNPHFNSYKSNLGLYYGTHYKPSYGNNLKKYVRPSYEDKIVTGDPSNGGYGSNAPMQYSRGYYDYTDEHMKNHNWNYKNSHI